MTSRATSPRHPPPQTPGHKGRRAQIAALGALGALALAVVPMATSRAVETRVAGSAQLDYLVVPTRPLARDITFDGFTTELSLRLSVDVTEHVAVSVKACASCHGLETGVAAIDLLPSPRFGLRIGRFTPRFGDFPARHDPANHRTSDKPLPYDMGRMLRMREWNFGVLPAPYVDNGVEVFGRAEIAAGKDLDWAAWVIGGLRASDGASDLDFLQLRSGERYYVDNNSLPSVGARLSFTALQRDGSWHVGASALGGVADPAQDLDYVLLGADASWVRGPWTLRAEYLLRRQRLGFGPDPASQFVYGPNRTGGYSTHFIKDGFNLELERRLGAAELIVRLDGLSRYGNVVVGSPIDARAWLLRGTVGVALRSHSNLRWKASLQWYEFSDFDSEAAMHLGAVAAF